MSNEECAVSVVDEAADAYYKHENYMAIPERIRKQISMEMLREIFDHMVMAAIDKVRELDRDGRE